VLVRRSPWRLGLTLALVFGVGAACDDNEGRSAGSQGSTGAPTGNLTVLAAASLTESFTELGRSFEAGHPGARVTFNFDSSAALATQANNDVPADLFASADETNMRKVVDAGNASDPEVFAHNRLAIVVAKGNPKKITGLADLAKPGVSFVLCAPEVPCGAYAAEAMRKAGVKGTPKSLETNVKGVVTKVATGQVDAGIGYATDARAAGAPAEGVDIPDEHNVVAAYPVAVLGQAPNAELARAFLDYILGTDAQGILARYGFSGL
jgi:molybdate transport system substrate-binding protein